MSISQKKNILEGQGGVFFHLLGKAFISGFGAMTSCSSSVDLGTLSH